MTKARMLTKRYSMLVAVALVDLLLVVGCASAATKTPASRSTSAIPTLASISGKPPVVRVQRLVERYKSATTATTTGQSR
jgi:hypothetical protein